LPAVDGLRFLGFFLVYCRHYSRPAPSTFLYEIGWTGVQLFFLISGFLLTRLLVKELQQHHKINIAKYFIRRILRIWPLYFFYLTGITLVSIFVFHKINYPRLLGNIFFYDNLNTALYGYTPNWSAAPLWSISLEEQYYLVLPFVIPFLYRLQKKLLVVLLATGFILLILSRLLLIQKDIAHPFIAVLPFSGDCFLAGIVLGLGIADDHLKKINSWVGLSCGLVFLSLMYFIPPRQVISYNQLYLYPLLTLGLLLIFFLVVYNDKGFPNKLFNNRYIAYAGKISFGLYLFHDPVIYCLNKVLENSDLWLKQTGFLIGLIISFLLATLSYELFEKRILRLKHKFSVVPSGKL
jgi:peptidoglycan/LPS O-acetylase OafA/YrhL